MKFVTFKNESGTFIGIVNEDGTHVLSLASASERMNGESAIPAAMIDAIALGEQFYQEAQKIVQWVKKQQLEEELYLPLESVKLLAPIPKPSNQPYVLFPTYQTL